MRRPIKYGLIGAILPVGVVLFLSAIGWTLMVAGISFGFMITYALLIMASLIGGTVIEFLGLSVSTVEGGGTPTFDVQLLALAVVMLVGGVIGAIYGLRFRKGL